MISSPLLALLACAAAKPPVVAPLDVPGSDDPAVLPRFEALAPLPDGSAAALYEEPVPGGALLLTRIRPDGSTDGRYGRRWPDDNPVLMAMRHVEAFESGADGSLFAGGSGYLVRLRPDGSLDDAFGRAGSWGRIERLDPLADGRVVLQGIRFVTAQGSKAHLILLDPDGSLSAQPLPDEVTRQGHPLMVEEGPGGLSFLDFGGTTPRRWTPAGRDAWWRPQDAAPRFDITAIAPAGDGWVVGYQYRIPKLRDDTGRSDGMLVGVGRLSADGREFTLLGEGVGTCRPLRILAQPDGTITVQAGIVRGTWHQGPERYWLTEPGRESRHQVAESHPPHTMFLRLGPDGALDPALDLALEPLAWEPGSVPAFPDVEVGSDGAIWIWGDFLRWQGAPVAGVVVHLDRR